MVSTSRPVMVLKAWFVGGGDYHILDPSPAIDNASATYAPADDIDGDIRPQGAADDMGADEYTP